MTIRLITTKVKTALSIAAQRCMLTVAALSVCTTIGAQDGIDSTATMSPTVYTRSYMVGTGPVRLLDTYLSQEHFKGSGFTFLSTSEKRKGQRWFTMTEHQADISYTHDRSDNFNDISGIYKFYCGRLREWNKLYPGLTLRAGVMGMATLGFIYNTTAGNNPAQALAALQIMPTLGASYRFAAWGKPMMLRYEAQLPLAGLLFSPQYGQSYYEIFSKGDYDHNIVPTTMVAYPSFRQLITLDVGLCKHVSMRIGYLGDYEQSDVNSIKHHIYSHRIMIGVVKSFQLIKHKP